MQQEQPAVMAEETPHQKEQRLRQRFLEWLGGLAAGDTVVIDAYRSTNVGRVDRTTKTQIIVGSHRFRREDGRMVGGHSSYSRLVEPTAEKLERAKEHMLRTKYTSVLFSLDRHQREAPIELMRSIVAASEAHEQRMKTIDTGDIVKHEPTGEEWVVAYVRGEHLAWCGWPEGEARVADCQLLKKATLEQRQKWLQDMASMHGDDARKRYAQDRLRKEGGVLLAAKELLAHREGELPTKGWLRDNDASRAALGRLAEAVEEAEGK